MATNYHSSRETTNFARLSRVVVDVTCDLLTAVLKDKLPFPGLGAFLQSQKCQLSNHLEKRQQRVLYPAVGVFAGTLEELDFTLIYKLLRNLQGINIPQHQNGWGKTPDDADRSLSANIDRLRIQRNEAYGHLPTASLSDAEFNDRWGIIRQCVFEIEKDALTGDTYVTAVDYLLTTTMDPDTEKQYKEELQKQYKADLEVKNIILELKDEQKVIAIDINDVTTRQEVMATDITDVTTRQEVMATDITDVTTRQEAMATDIADVTTRQEAMATDISGVTTRQETIAGDMHHIKEKVTAVEEELHATAANTSHTKAIHPDLEPLIEKAKARIKREKEEKQFYVTKGFRDSQDKLRKNRILVIKGNTGDGKTSTAIQLLHWLNEEQRGSNPLQLHEIKNLDLLAPNSQLITFIDDIFGENDVGRKDVQEWNKRITDLKTLFVDEQNQTNFLLITIRNEVFNALKKRSVGKVFTKDNIIDLSADTYKIAEEKKEILELYKPKDKTFSWTKEEKEELLKCAPNIGFPQCCQLFCNSVELQKERVRFFQTPFQFLNAAISRLPECPAILFLFLNNGVIRVTDLDPNSVKVNETNYKKMLEEAFNINLFDDENYSSTLKDNQKIRFVKESLDKLLGFLVVKEKKWSGDEHDVYRFDHDSIHVAVALMYGHITPIGYIRNCPTNSLSYLTTSKTSTNKIVISSDHYAEMCERLFREFAIDRMKQYYRTNIGYIDVWKDQVIVEQFVRLLNDRKVDKRDIFNKACVYGAEECALYLLSEGVKPDKDTHSSVVYGGGEKLLNKILQYDVTETAASSPFKYNLLHNACLKGRTEIVSMLSATYPNLLHGTDWLGQTPIQFAAYKGSCSVFYAMERVVLKSLCRVEDEQHKCETVDGRVVHRRCACAQYMSQLVTSDGRTVLHLSCFGRQRDVCLYLCESYPVLSTIVDKDGCHCLHYVAGCMPDVDLFTECEKHVKQYVESTECKYDITTICDKWGISVLDSAHTRAKDWHDGHLYDYLVKVFGEKSKLEYFPDNKRKAYMNSHHGPFKALADLDHAMSELSLESDSDYGCKF